MGWANTKLIFLRELRDQLRDRRTLFMITVMPILLYPSIGIGMVQFTRVFTEQPRQVVVMGREHLPADPPLINGDRFVAELFDVPEETDQLQIVSEADAQEKLHSGEVQLILVVPQDIREQIEAGQGFQWQIIYNSADEKSRIAYLRLKAALDNWKQSIIRSRIEAKSLPPDFANPFEIAPQDIATPQQISGGLIWAKLFPFLLVVMSLTGAFYPAIDLCAGEKERGTIETLLISPASRGEIVMGKYLTIWLFSISTAVLNLLSMAATGWVVSRQVQSAMQGQASLAMLTPPSMVSAGWMLLLLIPLAAFFSALGIALAAFARSTKEGQYYLTPLFLVAMPLVLLTLAPGIELNAFYSMVPVTGAALLLKTLILGQYDLAFQFFLPVLLPIVLYAALALRWAIDQFNREEVLFREAERLDIWLWTRHLFRDKGPFPSATEAIFCYAIMLLLVWFVGVGGFLGVTLDAEGNVQQASLQRSLIVMQLAFVAGPPLIMAVMLTTNARQTLLALRPKWTYLVMALFLALALHPIIVEASQHIHRGFPPQSKWVGDQLKQLLGGDQPLWWQLFLIALLPAVCEEIAFRGFILSGLLRRMSVPTSIIVSGFLFGFFHMNPQQLLTATVLGWILGVIATRSGSLLPGILFHFANNASALLMANLQGHAEQSARDEQTPGLLDHLFERLYRQPFSDKISYEVPYQVVVLVVCGLIATMLLTWLLKQPIRSPGLAADVSASESEMAATMNLPGEQSPLELGSLPPATIRPLPPKTRDATS